MTEKIYDVVVIGAGPAGMTAAMYSARSEMKTLLLERGVPGGQMNNTAEIENYPGYGQIMGPELSMKMYEPLADLGVENAYGFVTSIVDNGATKTINTEEEVFETKSIIIATGANHRKLGVPGEEEYGARGVSYCAVCDGAFFRDQDILVVGGGDSAVEEAIFLTRFGKTVTIMHRRDELRAQKIIQERAFANEKIKFIWDSVLEEIKGDERKIESVRYKNVKTGEVTEANFGGLFIYVGLDAVSEFARDLGITDEEGWIITDATMKTSIPGIFAVGDVRQKDFRQITTAVGDGAQAAQEAYKYVEG
ncbi:thioredoxin-disulfide reductase [Lactococcus formosensis]|uniref:thioredoxin-disulfide reductase n=1 Tax=Lactococcus formosensis TaxID=1281486 RepID=UPI001BD0EB47|nr:thioredoxin-disulfide reductase [Lactococcus formosensis]MCO7181067.1 thioredoxin-disulfide reductase [Lactococcus formosensis]MDG6111412.1 thioredoxin-disulfide reductase [Lactococcus formosensis]MDG6113671.1 thioredoxin-disulfide reductase [Lactococcus formosensis]MDG6115475.1 thioredoxin-disulfide reductase [Lactococcus formosensis]MDG6117675.1 thioredoxin-disulfide reductase [Lactococcus formosensis]